MGMNPVLLSFLDGTTFFVGLLLVGLATGLLLLFENRWVKSGLTTGMLAGAILVVASATPLPMWLYGVWLAVCATALGLALGEWAPMKWKRVTALVAVLLSVGLAGMEIPWRIMPRVAVNARTTVYVIGDSISAGMGRDKTWPAMLEERTGLRVVNLAQAGARVEGAIKQAEKVPPGGGSVVIVEIGGNDLLGKATGAEFGERLDVLISGLKSKGHDVVMMEIPLVPFMNEYGRAQRTAARKYEAALVPKRVFAAVLGLPDGTIDGLHLSAKGHEAMAHAIQDVLEQKAVK